MTQLTRRSILAGAAVTAAGFAGVAPGQAATPPAGKQAPSYYRYKIGSMEVTVVSDGARTFPLADGLVSNAKKDQVAETLAAAHLRTDMVTFHFGPVVINTGSKLIVIDTGNGPADFASSKGAVGQFTNNLIAAGIDPKAVDTVVISHFHGDHVNGLLTLEGQPNFPNAEILVPSVEWAFWSDAGEMSRAAPGRMAELFKNNRRVFEAGLKKKVTPYEWGKDVAPGLTAIATPGHTPGHTSYVLASGNDKVYIQSDVTNNPDIFARNPGWHGFFDQDPNLAEATRRKVYDMIVAEKLMLQGFHYPFPGVAHVEKDGAGYRAVPAPWSPVI